MREVYLTEDTTFGCPNIVTVYSVEQAEGWTCLTAPSPEVSVFRGMETRGKVAASGRLNHPARGHGAARPPIGAVVGGPGGSLVSPWTWR